jgi:hypothetical protein
MIAFRWLFPLTIARIHTVLRIALRFRADRDAAYLTYREGATREARQ